jgi:hypothetical protein
MKAARYAVQVWPRYDPDQRARIVLSTPEVREAIATAEEQRDRTFGARVWDRVGYRVLDERRAL